MMNNTVIIDISIGYRSITNNINKYSQNIAEVLCEHYKHCILVRRCACNTFTTSQTIFDI